MNTNFVLDLTDPITHDLFEDAINLTCCGKVISRPSLLQWMNTAYEPKCPLCNADISDLDIQHAPRNLTIMGMVETLRQQQGEEQFDVIAPPVVNRENITRETHWNTAIEQLVDEDDRPLPIGELKVELKSTGFVPNPTAFIIIADRSGSMDGQPFEQVKTALLHIFRRTHVNPHVRPKLIVYDHGADLIDTSGTLQQVENRIRQLNTGGSTYFSKAFEKVVQVLKGYQYKSVDDVRDESENNYISNVIVTLLTDGQDNSGEKVAELPGKYRKMLRECWEGPLAVHTIGFSENHDFNFLENLRNIGTSPGMYRYADPRDDGDTLCSKMTTLFDAISASSSVTTTLTLPSNCVFRQVDGQTSNHVKLQFPIDEDGRGCVTKWIMMGDNELDNANITIKSEISEETVVPTTVVRSGVRARKNLMKRLMVSLVDSLASETLDLSNKNRQKEPNAFDLHCALLIQHARAINSYISGDEELQTRLESVLQEIEALRAGKAINKGKLSDLKFASQVASTPKPPTDNTPKPTITHGSNDNGVIPRVSIFLKGGDRYWNEPIRAVMFGPRGKVPSALNNLTRTELNHVDRDGNTVLHWACYIGHRSALQLLLQSSFLDHGIMNLKNNHGDTAFALAVRNNRWKTVEILLRNGFSIPLEEGNTLLVYVLQREYFEAASLLLNNGLAEASAVDENSGISANAVTWLMNRTPGESIISGSTTAAMKLSGPKLNTYLKMAVRQGIYDVVRKLILEDGAQPDIMMLYESIVPNSPDHAAITKLLLENGVDGNGGVSEEGGADTPLFYAASKGAVEHVKLLIHCGADIERGNEKGNSPLWIAACNGHGDVCAELLNSGADPNLANKKGDTPLVGAVQKGHESIVLMLLMRSADVEHPNINGDTPLLIACRNGQAKVLEMLLSNASSDALRHKAKIDGFNALFAAVEADKPDCIQVLCDHGADLKETTDVDNPILQGGTVLHLAALYNRTDSARLLLQLGADPDSRDAHEATPFHYAVKQNHSKFVQLLRAAKADATLKDRFGYTAAFYANSAEIEKELTDPAYFILMKLANGEFGEQEELHAYDILLKNAGCIGCLDSRDAVDVTGADGQTPLMVAVANSKVALVKTLLKCRADPYCNDMRSLSAYFWSEYIGNKDMKKLLTEPPEHVKVQVERVRNASNGNVNNGLILYLNGKPREVVKLPVESTFLYRNEQSIGCIEKRYFDLNTSGSATISFFEKLGSSKIFSEGSKIMRMLLWKAKLFVVGAIASGCDLQPQLIFALYMYTSPTSLSKLVNEAVMNGSNLELIKPFIQTLREALAVLPAHVGEVYRNINTVCDRTLYRVGNEVDWSTFSSASLDWSTLGDFKNKKTGTVFIINSKSGRLVRAFSAFPQDGELIFAPGSRFRVVNWYKLTDSIVLQQKNIRQSAYGVKQDEVEKYVVGNIGLVIELDQIEEQDTEQI
jgi:ankyrin repeat protein/uncharacterized protein YegL